MSEQSTRHAPPFFCPYCGDEDIRPHGDTSSEWHCAACLRAFVVQLVATGVRR